MSRNIKDRRLRLWKIRQEAKGYDVSKVRTLEEAEAFNKLEIKPVLKSAEPEEAAAENETVPEADESTADNSNENAEAEQIGSGETTNTAPEKACHFDAAALEEKSYPELKKLAGDLGLPTNGKKPELIERICSVELCEKHDKENE